MYIKTFATLNTAGLATKKKRDHLDNQCQVSDVSFCALQETNLVEHRYDLTYGYIIGTPPIKAHAGLAFWLNKNITVRDIKIVDVLTDIVQELSLWVDNQFYVMYNLHLPHRDAQVEAALTSWIERLKFWRICPPQFESKSKVTIYASPVDKDNMDGHLDQNVGPQVEICPAELHPTFVVLGDFNMELERQDELHTQWKKVSARAHLNAVLSSLSLKNLPFSMVMVPPPPTRGRAILDYICVNRQLSLGIHSMEVAEFLGSDHSLVLARILVNAKMTKPPYWRFKNELLINPEFVKSMNDFLTTRTKDYPLYPDGFIKWWDSLKEDIITVSRNCWSRIRRQERRGGTESFLTTSKSRNFRDPPPQVHFLKEEDGSIIAEPNAILKRLASYFSNIYKSCDSVSAPPSNMSFGLCPIDPACQTEIDEPLSVGDLLNAASNMNLGKAPGVDGITLEFYHTFWSILGPLVLKWYSSILSMGKLSGSAGVGVITLINKAADPRLIQNWRPITLLTVELKIVARALASKLIPAIGTVIPPYQAGMPGRSIFTALSIVRDIISIHMTSDSPLCILALDQEKAFDRVNHVFLFHLMEVIKLPRLLIDSVKALYTGYFCVIKNTGSLSEPFSYIRGIRQGDPMSTALFTLALQPALNAVHLALYKEGFQLPTGDRILISAYADDVSVFLKRPESVKVVLETLDKVAKYSESSVNLLKSTVLGINVSEEMQEDFQKAIAPTPVSFNSIKILGIVFSPTLKILPIQWDPKMASSRETLAKNFSSLTKLTLLQRAQWAKRKLWPRWAFLLKTLQPTQSQLQQLSNLFTESLWLGGRHWLTAREVSANISVGGLEAVLPKDRVDIFRVMMISKLCAAHPSSNEAQLAEIIFNQYAGMGLGFKVFHSKPDHSQLSTLPAVYASALLAWDRLPVGIFPQSKKDILDLPVANSRFLMQLEDPIVLNCSLANSMKIVTIGDLYRMTPSVTRWSNNLVAGVKQAVDSWVFPPWPDGLTSGNQERNMDESTMKGPAFCLLVADNVIPIENWTNSIIKGIFKEELDIPRSVHIPSKTWKILFSVMAPSLFKNQMWKFLHKCVPTPSFYKHMGLIEELKCVLCGTTDGSYDHQFKSCPVLQAAIDTLSMFVENMDLPPLNEQTQLYPDPLDSHRLANFLVLSFIYTVTVVTRSVVNYGSRITKEMFNKMFLSVISGHLKCFASIYPPSLVETRYRWSTYTYKELLAYFKDDHLFILDGGAFRQYNEASKSCI